MDGSMESYCVNFYGVVGMVNMIGMVGSTKDNSVNFNMIIGCKSEQFLQYQSACDVWNHEQ